VNQSASHSALLEIQDQDVREDSFLPENDGAAFLVGADLRMTIEEKIKKEDILR
jgi:hypothetical protein